MENLDLLQIHQTWTDLREARVKDGFIFRVSRYFIDHWLRLLGPKAAWAVVDLQQRCYLGKNDFCLVSLKDLCTITGVRSTTTLQAIVDEPLMRWFFTKQTTRQRREGKVVRGKNRYDLHMSDPLTPEHQGQIARLLAERLRDGTVSAIHSPDDLIRLVSDLPPLTTLPNDDLPKWATCEPLTLRQIVLRVLAEAGIANVPAHLTDEPALRQAFAEAQASITQPTRIALTTHYFRTEWVSQLGAANAWLILILRSRCYWNKDQGEVRDLCVMSNQELAELLGASTRTVIRGLQDPLVRKFVAAQARVYERRDDSDRKLPSRTRFQVRLTMDPLTPPDEAIFAQMLLSDAARYGIDPSTGQMNMLDILDMMSQMTVDEISLRARSPDTTDMRIAVTDESTDKIGIRKPRLAAASSASGDKNGIRAQSQELEASLETEPSDTAEIREAEIEPVLVADGQLDSDPGDKNGIRTHMGGKTEIRAGDSSDRIGTISLESSDKIEKQYLNTLLNTFDGEVQQQQYSAADISSNLHQILIRYGIEEPALSRILANPQVTPELARAWMLYADTAPGLSRKEGYVIQRLIQSPPDVPTDTDLLLVASLSDEATANFARRRTLESRMGASVSFGDEQREAQYRAWLRFYGHEGDVSYGDETALESDTRRTLRWQPDIG